MNADTKNSDVSANKQRDNALDLLRGFSVLGILLMNVQGYGLISADYVNPVAKGPLPWFDWMAWGITHVFAEQKFMTLFCMLFGIGVMVSAQRQADRRVSAWPKFLKRSFWILIFGLAHAYLIWYGDVLTIYAFAGFIAFTMRKRSARTLAIVGLLLLTVPTLYSLTMGLNFAKLPAALQTQLAEAWTPPASAIAAERAAYLSGWLGQMPRRIQDAVFLQTFFMATLFFWRAAGLMLLGMALYRWGLINSQLGIKTYQRMACLGLVSGFVLIGIGIGSNQAHSWSVQYSMFIGNQFNYWGSILVAIGYVGLLAIAIQGSWWRPGQIVLASMGKVTLSTYIFHSVIGTLIFYGHGLGLYDHFGRLALLTMVPFLWALEIALMQMWLQRFEFGPAEFTLRFLSNGRKEHSSAYVPSASSATTQH